MIAAIKFDKRDWVTAALLFMAGFALRVPFRSRFAYHWDGAQFALAMQHYDIGLSLPHPPGFFLYVLAGRIVNGLVGDPHDSLVWMSVIAGALLAALGYLLATSMFGRSCGWATAAILVTSPLCWFQSEIALTTIVDGALVTATILVCWSASRTGVSWPRVVGLAALLAIVAGTRGQTAPVLLPVWLYTFWRFARPRWPKLAVGAALAALFMAMWFYPMTQLSGGLQNYLRLVSLKAEFDAPKTPWGGGFGAAQRSVNMIVDSCWAGLLAAALIGSFELVQWVFREDRQVKRRFYANHSDQLVMLTLWIVPMAAFGIGMYTFSPGYILNYFPALAILAGLAVARFAQRFVRPANDVAVLTVRRRAVATAITIGFVSLVNAAVYLSPRQRAEHWLFGLRLTASEIRDHDRQLGQCFHAIRRACPPDRVLICHAGEFFLWGFRHFQYHMPEYENCIIVPDPSPGPPLGGKLWYARGNRFSLEDRFATHGSKSLLLVVPPGFASDIFASRFDPTKAALLEDSGGIIQTLPAASASE